METLGDDVFAEPPSHVDDDHLRERRSKFRFKSARPSSNDGESRHHRSRHSSRRHRSDRDDDPDTHSRRKRRRGDDHRHDKSRRAEAGTRAPSAPSPQQEQQQQQQQPHPFDQESSSLDPEAAFRESLFDAMADDEGAAYWEAIYGQPVHIYPQDTVNPRTGELERMTDEEYAAHVRQKMWEKTHAGSIEEQARRKRAREERAKQEREREARMEGERRIQREIERSLRRGGERKKKREWQERFRAYAAEWEKWDGGQDDIPWPTESGRRSDVEEEEVRRFFVRGLDLEGLGERGFAAQLKEQRVRWHPDKMQHRLGGREKADKNVIKDVTVIFQVIDTLWYDTRSKSK